MKPEKYPREWEKINKGLDRLMVPGGWLVAIEGGTETMTAVSMCFVADPNGDWQLEEEKGGS